MVAIWLPLLLLLAAFVVDIGNWFEHKRNLQMRADAGALAGGGAFAVLCSDDPIIDSTRKYAGDPAHASPYNVADAPTDQANVHVLINSTTYWNEGGTDFSDGGTPCAAGMVDVKITESNVPWFFGDLIPGTDFVPAISAHARVQIQALDTAFGALPVGVPDVDPQSASATFFNESTGAVLASTTLTKQGSSGGLQVWDNSSAPIAVPISASNIGVRIALGGAGSTTCGQPLVECYDAGTLDGSGTPTRGILYVRGWSSAGSGAQPNPPLARNVSLFTASACDPYFDSASCSIGVRAVVDFGPSGPAAVGAKVSAVVNGAEKPLTYDTTNAEWVSSGANYFSVAAGSGPVPVELRWEETIGTVGADACKTTGGNKCKGTFGTVQRWFGASTPRSGPIQAAEISEGGVGGSNSFQQGTTHSLVVRIGITGNLENATSVSDPIVALRVVGGSLNQSLDCDPNYSKLRDELAFGCRPTYTRNTGTACPNSVPALWGSPQPWPCVAAQTGSATNQVPAGMNLRILGDEKPSTCTSPNNWSMFPNIPPGDPRIVEVFLTPFGSFGGSGSTTVPVTQFATFYVTGWTAQGGGFANPCQGNGDDPVPNDDAGYIVGHFIKYVFTLNTGGGSGQPCSSTSFGSCIAVLTD